MEIFSPDNIEFCDLPSGHPPILLVVIDTEEEFDWTKNFDRRNTSVTAMQYIYRAQDIFNDFGIKPVYVIDYPIASQPQGFEPLSNYWQDGRCEIGVHLHPWVTPPFSEEVSALNSYAGNLPPELERQKLLSLVDCIEGNMGLRPRVYKAGRYGIGSNTSRILNELGFSVDLSVSAHMDHSGDGGPDFGKLDARPFLFGPVNDLLELPHTAGYAGFFNQASKKWHDWAVNPKRKKWHLVGAFARLNIVNKVRLSPEGHPAWELIALTRKLYKHGLRVFSFAFHSPSVVPGCTPYVRTEQELQAFIKTCRRYFEFFFDELNGMSMTATDVYDALTTSPSRKESQAV
ncbi:MAG: polysaccharide deacetylase family protein [Calditrichaeota bacterium]|nr:polysaccharide deacetylase family protein [Calditrichota bacterium]